jgi:hypothetical protein
MHAKFARIAKRSRCYMNVISTEVVRVISTQRYPPGRLPARAMGSIEQQVAPEVTAMTRREVNHEGNRRAER